jgi:putative Mn2+ efflux pump MntP
MEGKYMKKGVKKIICGAIIFVIGMLMPFAFIIPLFFQDSGTTFCTPGSVEIKVEKPGRYYLWNNYYTVFEGRSYSFDKQLPGGMTFSLVDKKNGSDVPMQTGSGMSSESGSQKRASVGYFDLPEPGQYTLSVTGNKQARIFSFGKSLFGNTIFMIGGMIIGFIFTFAAAIGALILIILGIIDLVRDTKSAHKFV